MSIETHVVGSCTLGVGSNLGASGALESADQVQDDRARDVAHHEACYDAMKCIQDAFRSQPNRLLRAQHQTPQHLQRSRKCIPQ